MFVLTSHLSLCMGVLNAHPVSKVPTVSFKAGANVAALARSGGRAYALSTPSLFRGTPHVVSWLYLPRPLLNVSRRLLVCSFSLPNHFLRHPHHLQSSFGFLAGFRVYCQCCGSSLSALLVRIIRGPPCRLQRYQERGR